MTEINQSTNQPKVYKIPMAQISVFLTKNNLRGLEIISLSAQIKLLLDFVLKELSTENLTELSYITKCYDLTLKKFEDENIDDLAESGIDNLLTQMMKKADQKSRLAFLYLLENENEIKFLVR